MKTVYDHRCWSRFHLVGIVEPDLDLDFHDWAHAQPEQYARWCEDADRWIDRMLDGGSRKAGHLPDWRTYRQEGERS